MTFNIIEYNNKLNVKENKNLTKFIIKENNSLIKFNIKEYFGKDGKNNFQLWQELPGNENKTLKDYFNTINLDRENNLIIGEVPIGIIDGQNSIFQSRNLFDVSSLEIFSNGLKLFITEDYNIYDSKFIYLNFSPQTGEIITINYKPLQ